jgi:hypothetical protein
MGHGVVADQVPASSYLTHDLGPLLNKPSDEEERRAHIVAGEHLEQLQSVRIVRPIVVCQSDLPRIVPRKNGPAKNLRTRPGIPYGEEGGRHSTGRPFN